MIEILGSNGVGKSTTAKAFLHKHAKCAYVDAYWCRAINPFPFTPSTKKAVTENIYCIFKNYLLCEDIDKIVFPYGFHSERKEIFDTVIRKLKEDGIAFELFPIVLKCSMQENIKRCAKCNNNIELAVILSLRAIQLLHILILLKKQ